MLVLCEYAFSFRTRHVSHGQKLWLIKNSFERWFPHGQVIVQRGDHNESRAWETRLMLDNYIHPPSSVCVHASTGIHCTNLVACKNTKQIRPILFSYP